MSLRPKAQKKATECLYSSNAQLVDHSSCPSSDVAFRVTRSKEKIHAKAAADQHLNVAQRVVEGSTTDHRSSIPNLGLLCKKTSRQHLLSLKKMRFNDPPDESTWTGHHLPSSGAEKCCDVQTPVVSTSGGRCRVQGLSRGLAVHRGQVQHMGQGVGLVHSLTRDEDLDTGNKQNRSKECTVGPTDCTRLGWSRGPGLSRKRKLNKDVDEACAKSDSEMTLESGKINQFCGDPVVVVCNMIDDSTYDNNMAQSAKNNSPKFSSLILPKGIRKELRISLSRLKLGGGVVDVNCREITNDVMSNTICSNSNALHSTNRAKFDECMMPHKDTMKEVRVSLSRLKLEKDCVQVKTSIINGHKQYIILPEEDHSTASVVREYSFASPSDGKQEIQIVVDELQCATPELERSFLSTSMENYDASLICLLPEKIVPLTVNKDDHQPSISADPLLTGSDESYCDVFDEDVNESTLVIDPTLNCTTDGTIINSMYRCDIIEEELGYDDVLFKFALYSSPESSSCDSSPPCPISPTEWKHFCVGENSLMTTSANSTSSPVFKDVPYSRSVGTLSRNVSVCEPGLSVEIEIEITEAYSGLPGMVETSDDGKHKGDVFPSENLISTSDAGEECQQIASQMKTQLHESQKFVEDMRHPEKLRDSIGKTLATSDNNHLGQVSDVDQILAENVHAMSERITGRPQEQAETFSSNHIRDGTSQSSVGITGLLSEFSIDNSQQQIAEDVNFIQTFDQLNSSPFEDGERCTVPDGNTSLQYFSESKSSESNRNSLLRESSSSFQQRQLSQEAAGVPERSGININLIDASDGDSSPLQVSGRRISPSDILAENTSPLPGSCSSLLQGMNGNVDIFPCPALLSVSGGDCNRSGELDEDIEGSISPIQVSSGNTGSFQKLSENSCSPEEQIRNTSNHDLIVHNISDNSTNPCQDSLRIGSPLRESNKHTSSLQHTVENTSYHSELDDTVSLLQDSIESSDSVPILTADFDYGRESSLHEKPDSSSGLQQETDNRDETGQSECHLSNDPGGGEPIISHRNNISGSVTVLWPVTCPPSRSEVLKDMLTSCLAHNPQQEAYYSNVEDLPLQAKPR